MNSQVVLARNTDTVPRRSTAHPYLSFSIVATHLLITTHTPLFEELTIATTTTFFHTRSTANTITTMQSFVAVASLLCSSALALMITSPNQGTVWRTGQSQSITWNTVNTDQPTFNVYLSNFASYPTQTILLAENVASGSSPLSVDGSKLVAGNAFQINFTNGTRTEQIYAQSNQFNIVQGTAASSSASSSSTARPSTVTGSARSTGTPVVGSNTTTSTGVSQTNGTTAGTAGTVPANRSGADKAVVGPLAVVAAIAVMAF